jgi:hypothetical protein
MKKLARSETKLTDDITEYILDRTGLSLLKVRGKRLAQNYIAFTFYGPVWQELYRSVSGKYIYHEYFPVTNKHGVKIAEHVDARQLLNEKTKYLFEKAAKIDTELVQYLYEDIG